MPTCGQCCTAAATCCQPPQPSTVHADLSEVEAGEILGDNCWAWHTTAMHGTLEAHSIEGTAA